jgi:hypothetical protein
MTKRFGMAKPRHAVPRGVGIHPATGGSNRQNRFGVDEDAGETLFRDLGADGVLDVVGDLVRLEERQLGSMRTSSSTK